MPIMSWLQRRPSGVYRVRRVVPERLREYFDGRTIITRGLGTRDPVVAKRKGLVVAAEIERQFAEADAALKNPTVATYKAIQKYAEEDRQRPRSDREEEGFDSWLDDRLEEEDRGERVLSERDRAMLAYVEKLTKNPVSIWRDDMETLRAVGFDDTAILQITLIAAWFNYINRVADALGVGRE